MKTFWTVALGACTGTLLAHFLLDSATIFLWLRGHDWAGALIIGLLIILAATIFIAAVGEWVEDRERRRS